MKKKFFHFQFHFLVLSSVVVAVITQKPRSLPTATDMCCKEPQISKKSLFSRNWMQALNHSVLKHLVQKAAYCSVNIKESLFLKINNNTYMKTKIPFQRPHIQSPCELFSRCVGWMCNTLCFCMCRNPDRDKMPWCYTLSDSAISWEYCAVPSCRMPVCECIWFYSLFWQSKWKIMYKFVRTLLYISSRYRCI